MCSGGPSNGRHCSWRWQRRELVLRRDWQRGLGEAAAPGDGWRWWRERACAASPRVLAVLQLPGLEAEVVAERTDLADGEVMDGGGGRALPTVAASSGAARGGGRLGEEERKRGLGEEKDNCGGRRARGLGERATVGRVFTARGAGYIPQTQNDYFAHRNGRLRSKRVFTL